MVEKKNSERVSREINIYGIVQGVGFRPFVKRLADQFGLAGWIENCNGFVRIVVSGESCQVKAFTAQVINNPPKKANISDYNINNIDYTNFSEFQIRHSCDILSEQKGTFILPDLPVCDECLAEIFDKDNRRADYPLISCTHCGPRYSIMEVNPYDRQTTVMKDFSLCPRCESEYTSVADRRFHAQTISCHDCGPFVRLLSGGEEFEKQEAVEKAVLMLRQGKIIAIKGIGGYHIACNPFSDEVCERLRTIKLRPNKAFAVMFSEIEAIREYCEVSPDEEKLLKSDVRPIVLLNRKDSNICKSVYKDSRFLGCMLAYTPLQHILIKKCGPLVMTSANISDEPIIYEDLPAIAFANEHLDGILHHDRRICSGIDDCVARVICGQTQYFRRGRGITPLPLKIEESAKSVFAMGGQLKSSFCILKNKYAFQSQYFGDLDNIHTIVEYKNNYERMKKLLNFEPAAVACDLHPTYETTQMAKQMNIEAVGVQHHVAHFASVMAEHNLNEAIGVIFDGTGYGCDGAIWGGEFFVADKKGFRRVAHLEYIDIPASDSTMKNAMISAGCFKLALGVKPENELENTLEKARKASINQIKTSSMGRLFDAVSSIIGICHANSYEGECAIILENCAVSAIKSGIKPIELSFEIKESDEITISAEKLIKTLITSVKNSIEQEPLAIGFHYAVADMIKALCLILSKKTGFKTVALSGGVFQNEVLTKLAVEMLGDVGFKVYLNGTVPPNDSGIAVGQAFVASRGLELV